jgi:hypothetical protein
MPKINSKNVKHTNIIIHCSRAYFLILRWHNCQTWKFQHWRRQIQRENSRKGFYRMRRTGNEASVRKNDNDLEPFHELEISEAKEGLRQIALLEQHRKRHSNVSLTHAIYLGKVLNFLEGIYPSKLAVFDACRMHCNVSFSQSYSYFYMGLHKTYTQYPTIRRSNCPIRFIHAKMRTITNKLDEIAANGTAEERQFWQTP